MIISYDFGHMEGGQDTSANGIVYEYAEIRKYAPVCVQDLINAGHTLVNCTPPDGSGMTLMESLEYRVEKSDASGSQVHICFHVNAFDGSAHGAEIEVASDAGAAIATPILDEICALGFSRRGIKEPSLYITKNDDAVAVLIEPFFCDSSQDCSIYDPVKLGHAIAKGVLKAVGGNFVPSSPAAPSGSAKDVQHALNKLNFKGSNGLALTEDGQIGPNSVFAIKAFQVANKLAADGIPGPKTWGVLSAALNLSPNVQIQKALNALGYKGMYGAALIEDGVLGPNSVFAIKAFQRAAGISADGIVGPITITKLENALNARA